MLVERGADPCFKNRKGKTPCDLAAPAVHNFLTTARGKLIKKKRGKKKLNTLPFGVFVNISTGIS